VAVPEHPAAGLLLEFRYAKPVSDHDRIVGQSIADSLTGFVPPI
jgi:hypothetical protein